MNVFVDTSALLAVLDGDAAEHQAAKTQWAGMIARGDKLVTHSYVLVEASALVSRRLGLEALRVFEMDVVPVLILVWVGKEIHEAAVGALLGAARRDLSLVDCVSFEIMRRTGLRAAFAFDRRFADFGFDLVPG